MLPAIAIYVLAAFAEIAGSFAFWAWLKLGKSPLLLLPAMMALATFAWLLTRTDIEFAGRAYAAYGGIYIICAVVWMILIEGQRPSVWDMAGVALCLAGATVILAGSAIRGP